MSKVFKDGIANQIAHAMAAGYRRDRVHHRRNTDKFRNKHRSLVVATTVTSMNENLPFGFGGADREPGGSDDLSAQIPLFAELQKLLS